MTAAEKTITVEQREAEMAAANRALDRAAELWLDARTQGCLDERTEADLAAAIQASRRAASKLQKTRRRIEKQGEAGR